MNLTTLSTKWSSETIGLIAGGSGSIGIILMIVFCMSTWGTPACRIGQMIARCFHLRPSPLDIPPHAVKERGRINKAAEEEELSVIPKSSAIETVV